MPKHNNNNEKLQGYSMKAICLLYAYLNNVPLACESLKNDIKAIIIIAPKLIAVTISFLQLEYV